MRFLSRFFANRNNRPTPPERAQQIARIPGENRSLPDLIKAGDTAYSKALWDESITHFQAAIAKDPCHAHAHYMLGALALQKGDADACIRYTQKAILLQPTVADYHFSLANTLIFRGNKEKAIEHYEEAIRLKPHLPEWHVSLGAALVENDRLSDAQQLFQPDATPEDTDAVYELGSFFYAHKHLNAAQSLFELCATRDPDHAVYSLMIAACLRDRHMIVRAEPYARKATERDPTLADAWFMLGNILSRQARHSEAVVFYRKAIELVPGYDAAWRSLLFSSNYCDRWNPADVFAVHREAAKRFPPAERPAIPASHREPGHRLRIGYLSGDFRRHPVAYFIKPILENHDRAQFEIFCYSTGHEDEITPGLVMAAEHWRHASGTSDDELEQLLRTDDLDILVDLAGHSDGHRLAVVARRTAPIQVTYLGYPNTTGLDAVDYRITDAIADPVGEADTLHSEKLVRLPDSFLCFSPPFHGDYSTTPPAIEKGYVTFGSFNNFAKITPFTVTLWVNVMRAIENSRFLIKTWGLEDPDLRKQFLVPFEEAGIDPGRITIELPTPDFESHMKTYSTIDIALDTYPYHGTTTTMDALWMGVPVITLAGDRHAARVSASILTALGLPGLVAHSGEDYVAIASRLATNREELQKLRLSMRNKLAASSLLDAPRFTQQLEQAYMTLWETALGRH